MMKQEDSPDAGALVAEVGESEIVSQLTAVAAHIWSALTLADAGGDALLGAKLGDCLLYVESSLAALGVDSALGMTQV